jgi:phosphohistidine phosphatase
VKICIVRHGAATIGSLDDEHRPLTEKGIIQARAAGRWLATQEWNNPEILVSPYFRARQTADAIRESAHLDIKESRLLVPGANVSALISSIAEADRDLILVSHLPLVGHLAAWLVEGQLFDQPWSPAECWILEGEIPGPACMSVSTVWYPALEEI